MYYMGIDIGGTKIAAGIVGEDYRILRRGAVPTPHGGSGEELCDAAAALVLSLAQQADLTLTDFPWIGVGSPGYINAKAGVNLFSGNLGLRGVPMAAMLERRLDRRVFLCNDANAAAYGEAVAGAARGVQRSLTVTLGTGIGGGFVTQGYVDFPAGEVGHMVIAADGEPCTCGRCGCWEAYASATALIRQTKAAMAAHPESALWAFCGGDPNRVTGKTAFDAQAAGDLAAAQVTSRYIRYLAIGLANLMNMFEPQMVCIGGGISGQGETLFGPLRRLIREMVFAPEIADRSRIVPAALGAEAGIVGAALLGKWSVGKTDHLNLPTSEQPWPGLPDCDDSAKNWASAEGEGDSF